VTKSSAHLTLGLGDAREKPKNAHMKLLFRHALVGSALLFVSTDAVAQVNIEILRKRIKQKGVSFVLEGTFDGHTGNTTGLTADGLIGGGVLRTDTELKNVLMLSL
jgi:hypothetical protein